ncbi:MAG: hypothetical protein LWX70_16610, partial [Sphingobacteriia bacterium]|nr:hypothetical protein [Sphingobacteriia bacterium]
RDEETGLYYYGARYYAAWLCRFVSVDPLQFKYPHYTPYQYAGNKPVSYIDLDGLEEAKNEESKTGFYIKEGDDKAKSDIFELAQGKKYIDISETGAVTMSRKFYKLSSEEQTELLEENDGLKLIYDLTSATYTDENGTVKDAKILYQTEGDFQFNGYLEPTEETPPKDWPIHSDGEFSDLDNVKQFYFGASITEYGLDLNDNMQKTILPKIGFQGQVALAKGTPYLAEQKQNRIPRSADGSGRITHVDIYYEEKLKDIRSDVVKHELREMLFRIKDGLSYRAAHEATVKLYGYKGSNVSKFRWEI